MTLRSGVRTTLGRTAAAVAAIGAAAVVMAWARIPGTPWWIVGCLAILWLLASAGRREPLLIAAAFVPLASILSGWQQWPAPVIEPLVLAVIGGWLTRLVLGRDEIALAPPIRDAWALLILAVLVSLVVELAVLQLFVPEPSRLAARLVDGPGYLIDRGAFPPVQAALLWLEGLALFAMTASMLRDEQGQRQFLVMSLAGAAGAAALNVTRLLTILLRDQDAPSTVGSAAVPLRINVHHADVNAAGSYFAMTTLAAAGLAWRDRRGATGLWIAAVLTGAGLWLTGSRIAILCTAAGLIAMLAARALANVSRRRWVSLGAAAAVATVLLVVAIRDPARFGGFQAREAVRVRVELTKMSARMIASHPLFGVGIGRFYQMSSAFASPALLREYARENAHNYFLQVWGELGLTGLAVFVWLLAAVLMTRRERSGVALAVRGGLWVFLATWLTGHPLLIRDVAYPFWMLLGLAAVPSASLGAPVHVSGPRYLRTLRLAAIAVLCLSIVPRAIQQRREANLEETAFGVSDWYRDESGTWVRNLGAHVTFFVPGARVAIIPVRLSPGGDRDIPVQVLLDGRPANEVIVRGRDWQQVRIDLPPLRDGRRFHRLELEVPAASAGPPPQPSIVMGRVMSLP